MTKCVMREFENLGESVVGDTLKEARKIVKESCKHPGGILPPDECIKLFIDKKNESKHLVCTNDEELRNDLRNLGTVPIFFFKHNILVMDSPTEITEEKHRMVCLSDFKPSSCIERIIEEWANQIRKEILEGLIRGDQGIPQGRKGKRSF